MERETKSQVEVRTALANFLNTLTSLLNTVKPLIEATTDEELCKHPIYQPAPWPSSVTGASMTDDDEVPF